MSYVRVPTTSVKEQGSLQHCSHWDAFAIASADTATCCIHLRGAMDKHRCDASTKLEPTVVRM